VWGEDGASSPQARPFMWLFERAPLVVLFNQRGGVYLGGRFPRVVCVWISLPLEEILQGLPSSVQAVINDGLDLVLVFTLDQFGGWLDVVGAVLWSLAIRGEEAGVEHVMDLPGFG
jgi:hypothetical protein